MDNGNGMERWLAWLLLNLSWVQILPFTEVPLGSYLSFTTVALLKAHLSDVSTLGDEKGSREVQEHF